MKIAQLILQIVISLGIFNVWFLRFGSSTTWRGGSATNMKEEFAAYGLPLAVMYVVGFLKVLCAVLLLVGIRMPALVAPAAGGIALLMLGAIVMHFRIGDAPRKSLPAAILLLLSVLLVVLTRI